VDEKSEILFNEVQQLIEQYKVEVPGDRRAWPESIKNRLLELCEGGLRYQDVAQRSGIPYHTLLGWRFRKKKRDAFKEIAVKSLVGESLSTVTVGKKLKVTKSLQTLTVTVGNQIRVEGLDLVGVLKIIKEVGGRRGDSI
jgi:transposase-like protein